MRILMAAFLLFFIIFCRNKPAENEPAAGVHEYVELDWQYAFDMPKKITLHRMRDSIWIITAEFDKSNYLTREKIDYPLGPGGRADTVFYYQNLTVREWQKADSLLQVADFWASPPTINDATIDGTYWTFRARSKEKQHIITRCSPLSSELLDVARYTIGLAGYKDTIN